MPQELHVVRCYACKTFQVQIVKKVNKWQCKLCNEKQSILKVYAQGSGKDCRQYVQDLNMQQGLLMSQVTSDHDGVYSVEPEPFLHDKELPLSQKGSKWDEYVENEKPNIDLRQKPGAWEEDDHVVHPPMHTSRGKKRKFSFQDSCTFKGDFIDEESCQPVSQAVCNSRSTLCTSDTSQSNYANPKIAECQESPTHTSPASHSSCSRWSAFISQSITSPKFVHEPETGASFSAPEDGEGEDNSNPYLHRISPLFAGADCTPQMSKFKSSDNNLSMPKRSGSEDKINPHGFKVRKNPFCTTEDDNLDTLLDF